MTKKKNPVEEEVAMDVTPMIDVTFQLLIFFIITLKFKLLEKKLSSHLPTDYGGQVGPIVDETFREVRLKQSGDESVPIRERQTKYFIDREEITGSSEEEILARIQTRLTSFRSLNKDATGKINVGIGVPHKKVVRILDIFNGAEYEKIAYTGLASSKNIVSGKNVWIRVRKDLGDIP